MDDLQVIDSSLSKIVLKYLELRDSLNDEERITIIGAINRISHPLVIYRKQDGEKDSNPNP